MTISNEGLALIKHFEHFEPRKYFCAAGKPTIGYGHVIQPGEEHYNAASLTEAQASELLRQDMKTYVPAVSHALNGTPVTQHQFDALTSFAYNCGSGAVEKLVPHLKFNPVDAWTTNFRFGQWCHVGKTVLRDLVLRRHMEAALFLK